VTDPKGRSVLSWAPISARSVLQTALAAFDLHQVSRYSSRLAFAVDAQRPDCAAHAYRISARLEPTSDLGRIRMMNDVRDALQRERAQERGRD
jgi:hypothetical protein